MIQEAFERGDSAADFWPQQSWWVPTEWDEAVLRLAETYSALAVARWIAPANPLLAVRCLEEADQMERLASLNTDDFELGQCAYDKARVLLGSITPTTNARTLFGDEYNKTGERIFNPFPTLAQLILQYSLTEGMERFASLTRDYFAPLFADGIIAAINLISTNLIDADDIPGLLSGIDADMLKAQYQAERWQPFEAESRSVPLVTIVNPERLAEDIAELLDLEFNFDWTTEPTPSVLRLVLDSTPGNDGARGLIHFCAFLPDYLIVDIRSLRGLWDSKMMRYVRCNPRLRVIPYILLTAHCMKEYDQVYEAEIREQAAAFICIPFISVDLLAAFRKSMDELHLWRGEAP